MGLRGKGKSEPEGEKGKEPSRDEIRGNSGGLPSRTIKTERKLLTGVRFTGEGGVPSPRWEIRDCVGAGRKPHQGREEAIKWTTFQRRKNFADSEL